MDNVSLTISKDIVQPIVNAKINEAILLAMGGSEFLIAKVVEQVFTQKVNQDGHISTYNSDNKYNWIDAVVTKTIKEATTIAINEIISTKQDLIKNEIIKQMSSKKGIEGFATQLLSGVSKITESYYSKVIVEFKDKNDR